MILYPGSKADDSDIFDFMNDYDQHFNLTRFESYHCFLFILSFVVIFVFFLLKNVLFKILCCFTKCFKERASHTGLNDIVSDDFYQELSFY